MRSKSFSSPTNEPPGEGATISLGVRIGSYRVVRKIGEGGMGTVFEATHEQIGCRAAIKVLHPEFVRDPKIVNRFFNEARAVNVIQHPSIVAIFECGLLADGTAFIIMEFLEGQTLTARLQPGHGQLNLSLVRVARQVASALAAAHRKSIVHRDLKPDNIMLVPDPEMSDGERVKILDFGIAKISAAHQQRGTTSMRTQAGMVMGTPAYMAPEQCSSADEATDKSDVYALGVILYEMLSGRPPFQAASMMELMVMQMKDPPPPLLEMKPELPPPLTTLVHRMLAKLPGDRPSMQTVAELLDAPGIPSIPLGLIRSRGAAPGAFASDPSFTQEGGPKDVPRMSRAVAVSAGLSFLSMAFAGGVMIRRPAAGPPPGVTQRNTPSAPPPPAKPAAQPLPEPPVGSGAIQATPAASGKHPGVPPPPPEHRARGGTVEGAPPVRAKAPASAMAPEPKVQSPPLGDSPTSTPHREVRDDEIEIVR